MSKKKEEEKENPVSMEVEDQETVDADSEVDDQVISETMPDLYQAIIDHNTTGIPGIMNPYNAAMEEAYTDEDCVTSDVHTILNTSFEGLVDGVAIGHRGFTPIQLADYLGFHDICSVFIRDYGDDVHECTAVVGEL